MKEPHLHCVWTLEMATDSSKGNQAKCPCNSDYLEDVFKFSMKVIRENYQDEF